MNFEFQVYAQFESFGKFGTDSNYFPFELGYDGSMDNCKFCGLIKLLRKPNVY